MLNSPDNMLPTSARRCRIQKALQIVPVVLAPQLPRRQRRGTDCASRCAMPPDNLQDRKSWPYSALLPYSMKAYPIVQLAPVVGPQLPSQWPPPMAPSVARWRDETEHLSSVGNQIYIHVPFCPHLCGFCPLFKVKGRSQPEKDAFINAIIREIELYGRIPSVAGQVYNTVYIGGGTGSELTPAEMARIFAALRRNFTLAEDSEITLEGVAKQMAAPGFMAESMEYGTNRISFGVESLDTQLRKQIGRGDPVAAYEKLVRICRDLDPQMMINAETMAALPGQSLESVEADVRGMLSWGLDSADVFYYVMMAGTKLQRLVASGRRAQPGYGASMLAMRARVLELFNEQGFSPVTGEVYSKTDRDLFTKTSFGGGGNCLNAVLALGPSAFGSLSGSVYQNVCDLDKYVEATREGYLPVHNATYLSVADAKRRAKILSVLRLEVPNALFNSPRDRLKVRKWESRGLLDKVPGGYKLSDRGILWYNHMQMELLPLHYLVKAAGAMFGSLDTETEEVAEENTQSYELTRLFGAYGWLGTVAFNAFMGARRFGLIDSRPVGFTGTVEA